MLRRPPVAAPGAAPVGPGIAAVLADAPVRADAPAVRAAVRADVAAVRAGIAAVRAAVAAVRAGIAAVRAGIAVRAGVAAVRTDAAAFLVGAAAVRAGARLLDGRSAASPPSGSHFARSCCACIFIHKSGVVWNAAASFHAVSGVMPRLPLTS